MDTESLPRRKVCRRGRLIPEIGILHASFRPTRPRPGVRATRFEGEANGSGEDTIHLDARDPSTVDSYDYDANCRRWPEVIGQFPVGTLEFEVSDTLRNSQYAPEPSVSRRL